MPPPTATAAPSAFAHADIDALLPRLSSEELIALTTGVGNWFTAPVPRLGVPGINVTDGPNGARGRKYFLGTPAKCLPCATALAATWDTALIAAAAAHILAPECKLKAASVLLGPTVNIQRSPLGGRSFESFSEDPHLSGMCAAAYVRSLQAQGVSACIKHFVGNEQEQERKGSDSLITPRALREVYLYPFMLAQKLAQPWSYMTSYNRINGTHCSEHPWLLGTLLREEWGFDGLVMSDWRGTYGVPEAYHAGLDLEMPGTDGWRTASKVLRSIEAKKLSLPVVRARARAVLQLVQRCAAGAPEILDGDQVERTHDTPADKALMRKVAGSAIVLLKNDGGILPLDKAKVRTLAIIGPSAKAAAFAGGGSASLKASYVVTPFEGITAALPKDVKVLYAEGCQGHRRAPPLTGRELMTDDGRAGLDATFYHQRDAAGSYSAPVDNFLLDSTDTLMNDSDIFFSSDEWYLVLRGKLRPQERKTTYRFGISVAGRAKLFVDGTLVIDNWTWQRRGDSFFGDGTEEEMGDFVMLPGRAYDIRLEYSNLTGPAQGDEKIVPNPHAGMRLGGHPLLDEEEGIKEAVELAKSADAVIVVVGLNGDWESEGYDRKNLDLPRRTNDLVAAVAKANPKAIVVTQAGSAFTMPWVDSVSALVHTWYLGNETGSAIADVLFGAVNPSGKLSLTFPKRIEDVPSHLNYGNQNGKVRYAEDLFVGYKHYQARDIEPLFPFGFGLSYTTFKYSDLDVSKPSSADVDFTASVKLTVTNTGKVAGSEVVQLYVSLPTGNLIHPIRTLKAFTKVLDLAPGKSATVLLSLDKYAVSYFDDRLDKWVADAGEYGILVGPSSDTIALQGSLSLPKSFTWLGL
ncbi:glycoside hydrolase family 3 protein [Calocera cornea HHB12733]|uniref:beta-glucosidase n=1 Tax=Calocera cornea HHB12733 TaxID=1353952 RepID=A0A165CRV7_9BASI|nr:glycoside hydrolase family 3 protein [Calocera cornea HHB12733]